MKKILLFLTVCVLLCNLWVVSYAAEEQMKVNDLTAAPGELLYLTISLENAAQADTVGVQLNYDPTLLEMVESECTWTHSGEIQDFSKQRQAGVWTKNKPEDLNGVLCTIALRVIAPTPTISTTMDCTVILKVRSDEVGRFQSEVSVSVTCEHQFGEWTNMDQSDHGRVCSVCQEQNLQPHQWGNGILGVDPDQPGVSVTFYTCQICNAEKKEGAEPAPTTKPTQPTQPTQAPAPSQGEKPTEPVTTPQVTDQPKVNNTGLLVAIVMVVVLAAAATAVVLWKKKK